MAQLKAGAAKVDITPDYPVWLDGNPRDRKSEGAHDPISARALVLESDDGPFSLVSLELCAMDGALIDEIRRSIYEATGVPKERQVIACAHIHSAPAAYGFFCEREAAYIEWLVPKIAELVVAAQEKAVPAVVGSGCGEEHTISEYRRLWHKDGRIVMNWDEFSWDDILGPAGVPDPEVGVVRIDGKDGDTIAVIYNHAGHPNTPPGTSFEISGDYPAYASKMIEEKLGGVALFTNGAQGSVDIPAFRERDWKGMERKGCWLGREVLRVAEDIRPDQSSFRVVREEFRVAMRQIDPKYLEWCRETLVASSDEAVTIRDGVNDAIYANMCMELVDAGAKEFDFEMLAFLIGDATFVTIPGELFTEIGLRIKEASPFDHTWILDLANGCLGYIPTARAIREGGYATRPGLHSRLDANADELVVKQALRTLGALHECTA